MERNPFKKAARGDPARLLGEVSDAVARAPADRPVCIGIDGITAAGKTRFAAALEAHLASCGRPLLRAGCDDYHHPRAHRVRRGEDCPVGYYEDSFDLAAIREDLLDPLHPRRHGPRTIRRGRFDFRREQAAGGAVEVVPDNSLLLFEGVFLFRPELVEAWDLRIFLDIGFDESLRRAEQRDLDRFGDLDRLRHRFRVRYHPGQAAYLDAHRPRERAHLLIDNTDPAAPRWQWQ